MRTHLSTRHGIKFQECGAFHSLRASVGGNAADAVAAASSGVISGHDGNTHVRYILSCKHHAIRQVFPQEYTLHIVTNIYKPEISSYSEERVAYSF